MHVCIILAIICRVTYRPGWVWWLLWLCWEAGCSDDEIHIILGLPVLQAGCSDVGYTCVSEFPAICIALCLERPKHIRQHWETTLLRCVRMDVAESGTWPSWWTVWDQGDGRVCESIVITLLLTVFCEEIKRFPLNFSFFMLSFCIENKYFVMLYIRGTVCLLSLNISSPTFNSVYWETIHPHQ